MVHSGSSHGKKPQLWNSPWNFGLKCRGLWMASRACWWPWLQSQATYEEIILEQRYFTTIFLCESCFLWYELPPLWLQLVLCVSPDARLQKYSSLLYALQYQRARRTALWIKPPEHQWWRVNTFCSPKTNWNCGALPVLFITCLISVYISDAGRTFFLCLNWSRPLKCFWILFCKSNIMKASHVKL